MRRPSMSTTSKRHPPYATDCPSLGDAAELRKSEASERVIALLVRQAFEAERKLDLVKREQAVHEQGAVLAPDDGRLLAQAPLGHVAYDRLEHVLAMLTRAWRSASSARSTGMLSCRTRAGRTAARRSSVRPARQASSRLRT
jgi:hypothetical protein